MKPELIYAKLRNGKSGTFRVLRAGEPMLIGDIGVGMGFLEFINDGNDGIVVGPNDTIIRLEFSE
jgi:hypothetical protein